MDPILCIIRIWNRTSQFFFRNFLNRLETKPEKTDHSKFLEKECVFVSEWGTVIPI